MNLKFRNNPVKMAVDAAIIASAYLLAFDLRFDGHWTALLKSQLWLVPLIVAGRLLVNYLSGIYRLLWRYIAIEDSFRISFTYSAFSLFLIALRLAPLPWPIVRLSFGVMAAELLLSLGGCLGVRLLWRFSQERGYGAIAKSGIQGDAWRVLLVGAGTLGVIVAKELAGHEGVQAVGFIDNDPGKQGARVSGLRVLGGNADLPRIAREETADEILICIRPTARNSLNDIWQMCDSLTIPTRIVPTMQEILAATADLAVLRRRVSRTLAVVTAPAKKPNLPLPVRSDLPSAPAKVRNKTILITGGAGFIGSALAEKLVADNHLVLFDRKFDGQPIAFTPLLQHSNVEVIQGDLLQSQELLEVARRAEIVIHTAAILGVQKVCSAALETMEVNYIGTSRLVSALQNHSRLERLLYFSTSEVYGVNSFRVDESKSPVIGPITDARWSYAISKLAGEHLVKSYYREMNLPGVIIRPFNVFGPRRIGDYALRRFLTNSLSGAPLEVYGDGSQIRAWCYIDDFCNAVIATLERPEAVGEDFNIGNSKNTLSTYQLACKVIEIVGSKSPVVFKSANFPDIDIRVPSTDKARQLLGYVPQFDMDEALQITAEWYRQNWDVFVPAAAAAVAH